MAKKKAAATKVTADELKNIQEKVTVINRQQMDIGGLEMQKQISIERLKEAQGALTVVQQDLEKKYGKVSVNLNDGSLKNVKDAADSKN
tara:strand:+ start:596 stop:862 length:267 start_codon:yes stop_codon:yes gene_type:complete